MTKAQVWTVIGLGFMFVCVIAGAIVPKSDSNSATPTPTITSTQTITKTETVSTPGPTVTVPAPVNSSTATCASALTAADAMAVASDKLQATYASQATIIAKVKTAIYAQDTKALIAAQQEINQIDTTLSAVRSEYNRLRGEYNNAKDSC